MYKMLSVCLALTISLNATEVKTNNQSKTNPPVELKKAKTFENTLINVQSDIKSNKTKTITSEKLNNISSLEALNKLEGLNIKHTKKEKAEKTGRVGTTSEKRRIESETKPNAQGLITVQDPTFKDFDEEKKIDNEKLILQGKKEENSPRRPEYIQGPRKTFNLNQPSNLTRDHETLFISEYAEGSSNNKYIELFNPTDASIDLADYELWRISNGGDWTEGAGNSVNIQGTVASGDVWVICNSQADQTIKDQADSIGSAITYYNGDDAVGLAHNGVLIDAVGASGSDPGSGWDVAGVSNATKEHTLVRKPNVASGNQGDWATSAGTTTEDSEWVVYDQDTWTYLGAHVMEVVEEGVYFAEDFEGTFPPNGWTNSLAYPWQQGPSTNFSDPDDAFSGSYAAYFDDYNYSSGSVGDFITPDIDLTNAVSPKLSFYYYDGGGSDIVDVQVGNSTDGYTSLLSTPTSTAGWELIEAPLTSYVGQVVNVRFVGTSVWGTSNPHIDDVFVAEPPTFPIAGISTDYMGFGEVSASGSLTANFAITNSGGGDLTATASSTNSKFVVGAIPGRIAPNATVSVGVTYTPTAVVEDSGFVIITHNGDSSPDTIEVFGSGTLDLLSQGFDENWVGTPSAPLGWSQITVSGTAPFRRSTSYGGTAYAPNTVGGGEHVLISPVMDLTAGYNLFYRLDGSTLAGTDLKVQISSQNTDATTGWTDLVHYVAGTNMPGTWEDIVIDLGAYSGDHYIAFRLIDDYGYSFYLDDITVELKPTVASIELNTNDIDFGSNYVSSSLAKTVNVSNSLGGAAANLTIVSSNSKFVPAVASQTIAAGGSFDLSITYTPTEVADDSGYVVLTHEGASSPDTIDVSGSGNMNLITEGFDEDWVGTPSAPAGWSQITVSGTTPWRRSTSYGGTAYGAWTSAGGEHVLISPAMDITSGYNLLFRLDGSTSSGTDLKVQISSQNTDATTGWTDLAHYVAGTNMPGTWEDIVIDLGAYTGNQYIAFRLLDANGYSLYLDDVIVEPKPVVTVLSLSTYDVSMIPVELDSSRTATIGISNAGVGDLSGTITYTTGLSGPAAFTNTDDSVNVVFTGTQLGSFSGSVYFASNGGNDTVDVSTVVGKSVATWDDDFDGDGETDWPVGWEVTQVADESGNFVGDGWEFFTDGGHTGDGYTNASYGASGTVNNDWLITPIYQVVAGDSFIFHGSDDGAGDIMTVHVSTTASNNPSSFTVQLDSVTDMTSTWVKYSYDLSSYAGTDVRLAIVYRGAYAWGVNIDDVLGPKVIAPTGPIIYEYPTSLDFTSLGTAVKVGESKSLVFDYLNSGGADLEITALTFDGPFALSSGSTLPVVTGVGGLGGFDVVFTPLADSLYMGSMVVTHNAGDPITVSLTGVGHDAIFRQDFGTYDADAGYTPLYGWTWNDNGVSDTVPDYLNMTGSAWQRASLSGDAMLYHTYGSAGIVDSDTIISPAIPLPDATTGYHYELETREYQAYLDYAAAFGGMCGVAVSSDGGVTFTMVGETNYNHVSYGTTYNHSYNLSGFSGDTIHIAFIYQGMDAAAHATYGISQIWGVTTMEIVEKEDPTDPVFAHSKLVFPVTVVGETVSRKMFFQNIGAGTFNGSITYPPSMSGPASIAGLVPGTTDSMVVTYTPSTAGIETGDITIDGSTSVDNNGVASNIGVLPMGVHANAGELAFDLETRSAGWSEYSLAGQTYVNPSGSISLDTWRWYGGTGHSGPNYYGVYSYAPRWGGVNDYLVSPRYSVDANVSEVLSFFTQGGYPDGSERDSINVWVSTEQPEMGFALDTSGVIVDTGFVNPTSAFTLVYESLPSFNKWDPVNIDLSTYDTDVWVIIQSVQRYKEDGSMDGWMLKVDDLGTPDIYVNPLPVLRVGTRYDFGVTTPDGDSVKYFIRNTGSMDLVIDSMNFDDGMYFDVEYADTFPITIIPGGIDSIQVFWMPEMEGRQTDTLRYFSNYTVDEVDAFGFGTDHSVFTADAFNAPPGSVMLLTPDPTATPLVTIDANNATGSTDFFWTNTSDPDGTPIEYIFEIMVPGDTLDTLLSSNSFSLDHSEVVEMMEELSVTSFDATWDVHAYDGFEETGSSNGPWALSFDAGWVLGGLDNNTIPDVFALHNNYPNPFNPVTNIKYDIPVASDVRIDIFNIAGEKVRTLVSREHQPGRYKIQWNATNEFGSPVATGMYIYKIHAKDFVSVKKLLLMK